MSIFLYLGGIASVLGAIGMGSIFIKKYPTLRMLDVTTSRAVQEKKLRDRIIEERMHRSLMRGGEKVIHAVRIPWKVLQRTFQRLAGKLVALERKYHKEYVQPARISSEDIQKMFSTAERAFHDERFQAAEDRLVELISVAPKFSPAYELFSRVYAEKREWKEAIESLVCYVGLAPKESERHFLLGSMYERSGEQIKALQAYVHALDTSPHNPKYLDARIRLALATRNISDAKDSLMVLREVNPENANIAKFTQELEDAEKA